MSADMKPGWVLEKIISGGQTGCDQVGLELGQDFGYQTGGWVPKGWKTDDGPAPWLGTRYGCVEHWSPGYAPRTDANVHAADATVWFGVESAGWKCTHAAVQRWSAHAQLNGTTPKRYLANPGVEELRDFIMKHSIRILNIAGNRLRTHPSSTATARVVLTDGLLPF